MNEQRELQPLLIVADNYRMAGDYAREHGVQRWEIDRRREILAMLRVAGFTEETR